MKFSGKQPATLAMAGWACLACAVISHAQNSKGDYIDAGARRMLASSDTAFALRAAQNDASEVRLGELAIKKAVDPDVKALGRQMVDDHAKASDQLQSIAHQENMTLPNTPGAGEEATYQRLSQLSGSAFDKAYLSTVLKSHERDSKAFHKELRRGKDADMKNFASQTLAVIEGHLEKIRALDTKTAARSVS